jgi:hypothetical protein
MAYGATLWNIVEFVPYADIAEGSKMKFSASDMVWKAIDLKGRLTTTHFRSDQTGDYEWVAAEDEG